MAIEGKLQSFSNLSNSIARTTVLTKIMTWLKIKPSIRSLSFRFFSFSSSLTKYCFKPWRVSLVSLSIIISKGYNFSYKIRFTWCMNLRQTGLMSFDKVAENIITCFSRGVSTKIFWTWLRISVVE